MQYPIQNQKKSQEIVSCDFFILLLVGEGGSSTTIEHHINIIRCGLPFITDIDSG